MPSNRHSYMVLAIVCVCALAICAFLSWQNREKKNRLAAVRGIFHAADLEGKHAGTTESPA